jgi:hypothetical protein
MKVIQYNEIDARGYTIKDRIVECRCGKPVTCSGEYNECYCGRMLMKSGEEWSLV